MTGCSVTEATTAGSLGLAALVGVILSAFTARFVEGTGTFEGELLVAFCKTFSAFRDCGEGDTPDAALPAMEDLATERGVALLGVPFAPEEAVAAGAILLEAAGDDAEAPALSADLIASAVARARCLLAAVGAVTLLEEEDADIAFPVGSLASLESEELALAGIRLLDGVAALPEAR